MLIWQLGTAASDSTESNLQLCKLPPWEFPPPILVWIDKSPGLHWQKIRSTKPDYKLGRPPLKATVSWWFGSVCSHFLLARSSLLQLMQLIKPGLTNGSHVFIYSAQNWVSILRAIKSNNSNVNYAGPDSCQTVFASPNSSLEYKRATNGKVQQCHPI